MDIISSLMSKITNMGRKEELKFSFGKLTKQELLFLGCYLVLFKVCTALYEYTLQGGDVKFIKDHMASFGVCLVVSAVGTLMLTVLPLFSFKKINPFIKALSLGVGWLVFLNSALADLSTTLLHHGQYNLTGFVGFWVVGFFLIYIAKFFGAARSKLGNCKFWGIFGGVLVVGWWFWAEKSLVALNEWNRGLGGDHLLYLWNKCDIILESTPWAGIFPDRTFNFYMGSDKCPEVHKFSQLNNGVLSLSCWDQKATVVEYPDFLTHHNDEFILEELGIAEWKAKSLEKRYDLPRVGNFNVTAKYFQVFCGGQENYYVQNLKDENIKQRLGSFSRSGTKLNLLVFQIDTLSRAHFMRKMQATVDTLERLNSTYRVFQMLRLSTVGYNTELNTKAIYTGSQARKERSGEPIWKIFKEQGNAVLYLNGFCEDWSYRFLKKRMQGVDDFVFQPWCHPEYTPVNTTFSNFNGVNSMRRRCINGEHVHDRVFGYLKEFWTNYQEQGKMALLPMQEAHEASMEVIKTLDLSFSKLLEWLDHSKELNKTVVLITSDHGSHMSLYYTFSGAGRVEHKMPNWVGVFPKWLVEKYPFIGKGLLRNKQRLISPYDTYWTVRHLAELPEFGGPSSHPRNYTSIWDCSANEKYIKDIWYFKGKQFYNMDGWEGFELQVPNVFKHMEHCMQTYSEKSPKTNPMKHTLSAEKASFLGYKHQFYIGLENIPPCTANKCYDVTVFDLIKDMDSYLWFLDAAMDLEMLSWAKKDTPKNFTEEKLLDSKAWSEYKAQTSGRYKFGQSLFKYVEDRNCLEIGSMDCACYQN